MNRSAFGRAAAVAIPIALVAAAGWAVLPRSSAHPAVAQAEIPVKRPAACASLPARFTGVALPAPQGRTLPAFTAASGVRPQVLEYYAKFGFGFIFGPALAAESAGAVPLLQWIPPSYDPLSQIAAGKYDSYLRQFAVSVRTFGCPLMLSFGHEFNGPWWPWGRGKQSPASFTAAWRHIYEVLEQAGVRNVTWVWNPNVASGPAADPLPGGPVPRT